MGNWYATVIDYIEEEISLRFSGNSWVNTSEYCEDFEG